MAILVLEDTQLRMNLLERLLRGTSVEIIWAKTPEEFREYYLNRRVDIQLILLDYQLEIHTGMDVVPDIKAGSPPVLIWSCDDEHAPQMTSKLQNQGVVAEWLPCEGETIMLLQSTIKDIVKSAVII